MTRITARLNAWTERIANLWVVPTDTEDERLAKAIVTFASLLITCVATFWVVAYAALGLWLPAAIPLGYQLASILSFLYTYRTRRFALFRFSHLVMMLLLPVLLQWSLGGFAASGAVMLWALWAPIGALMFYGVRQALPWFAAYLGLTLVSGLLDGYLARRAPALPPALVVVLFVMTVVGVSTTVFVVLRYFARRREEALAALKRQHELLQAEQERSERLLLNILPAPIAERLKREPGVIADAFDEVTVLFVDIAGFTPLTARVPPGEMVRWLNEVFAAFDRLAERHGLEKIRTIGDSYMVVGGVPLPRPDHAEAVAELALDLLAVVAGIATPLGEPLRVRVGVNTGPAIAAVMGVRKFIYDVYGDAVNTASRMESHGVPGTIHVAAATYERLRDRYVFEERGTIEVKGKGAMTTYLLKGRKSASRPAMEVLHAARAAG